MPNSTSNTHKGHNYIIGGGIAGLSTAVYLLQEGHVPGPSLTVIEGSNALGGSLDANHEHAGQYVMRGFRMFEENVYSCTLDLLSRIPLSREATSTLRDDFIEFNDAVKTQANTRLVSDMKSINAAPLELSIADRLALLELLVMSEASMHGKRIDEYFTKSFFTSDFWYEYATTFSFLPWHGIAEFKRYLLRFLQDAPRLNVMDCIRSTRYNQYDSIMSPIIDWLRLQGVVFNMNQRVTNVEFSFQDQEKTATAIHVHADDTDTVVEVHPSDRVFITLGSMADNSSNGTMQSAPKPITTPAPAWSLWKHIADQNEDFGKPQVFAAKPEATQWTSFTMNFSDPTFLQVMEQFSQNAPGTDGLITFLDSPWLISLSIPRQPHFIDQPANAYVAWGYGLYSNAIGNVIKKPMHECSGQEILEELLSYLPFSDQQATIVESANIIPTSLPYITTQFMPHTPGDRPQVIPAGATNFAFLGQYVEIPEDIVFTVEYSVRSSQIAVYGLLGLATQVTPMYRGDRSPEVILSAIRTAFR